MEATICARDFEIHVDLVVDAGAEAAADELAAALREPLARYLFAEDERPIEELVLALCRARGLTLATAESCTGGLVAARLTSVPGSSDVFLGGVVAYANEVKEAELGVPTECCEAHGAVSAETAAAMAAGARARLGADVAVAVTGVAGPGGGTEEKPVGLVYFHASGPGGRAAGRVQRARRPGDDPRGAPRSRRSTSCGVFCHRVGTTERVTSPASVTGRCERLRLFCALQLPDDVRSTGSPRGSATLPASRRAHRAAGRTSTSRWPSSAAARRARLRPIGAALRAAAAARPAGRARECAATARRAASGCSSSTTRTGARRRSRRIWPGGWRRLGVYEREARPWLPHVTVLRFREPPRLAPPLPDLGEVSPSDAAVYHSRAAPRRGAVRRVSESVALGG